MRGRYLVALQQQGFNRFAFLARSLHALRQLLGREQAVRQQAVVLGGFAPGMLGRFLYALADGDGQRLAKLRDAVNFQLVEGAFALVVDELQHTLQQVAFQNRRDQHLARHETGALVHFFQKGQRRVYRLERFAVVDVG